MNFSFHQGNCLEVREQSAWFYQYYSGAQEKGPSRFWQGEKVSPGPALMDYLISF